MSISYNPAFLTWWSSAESTATTWTSVTDWEFAITIDWVARDIWPTWEVLLESKWVVNTTTEIYWTRQLWQNFTVWASNITVWAITLTIKKEWTPVWNTYIEIFAVDWSWFPTGAALATSTTVSTAFATSDAETVMLFASSVELTASTKYVFTIRNDSADASNDVEVRWMNPWNMSWWNSIFSSDWWSSWADVSSWAADLWFELKSGGWLDFQSQLLVTEQDTSWRTYDVWWVDTGRDRCRSQSFEASWSIKSVLITLKEWAWARSWNVKLRIYAASESLIPTWDELGLATIPTASLTSSLVDYMFTFDEAVPVNWTYCVVLSSPDSDPNWILVAWWLSSNSDLFTEVYINPISLISTAVWADMFFKAFSDIDMNDIASIIQTWVRETTSWTEIVTWSTDHFTITSWSVLSDSAITVTSTVSWWAWTDISWAWAADWMDCDTGNWTVTDSFLLSTAQDENFKRTMTWVDSVDSDLIIPLQVNPTNWALMIEA